MKTGYRVGELMTERPISLSKTHSISECSKVMEIHNVGAILVSDEGQLQGIITEKDIIHNAIAKGKNPLNLSVSDLMEADVATIEPNKDIYDAMILMSKLGVRHLPVIDEGKLVGLLTQKDILRLEPQLFDLIAYKLDVREIERKPIKSGVCNNCGELVENLSFVDGVQLCENCKN